MGTISPQEAASAYGISVSTSHVDFGTHYMQYGAWPITQTITITNNGAYQIGYDYSCGPYYEDKYVLEIHHPGLVEPGESGEITVSLWPKSVASGPVSVDFKVELTGYPSKTGNPDLPDLHWVYLTISDLFTVDFEVKSPKDADEGDIAWDVSADALDFGVVDFPYEETEGGYRIVPSYEYRSQELTVTNRGPLPFTLEAEVDTSACQNPDASKTFSAGYGAVQVDSGKTYIITVSAPGGSHTEGLVEGCVLKLKAYYPDSEERNTLTAEVPLSVKYLYDGGYQVLNVSDNSFGAVKTSDGVDRNPYSGNDLLLAKEGGSVTFVMTPYDPAAYHVSDIKLNGESVGTSDMVDNTYTISDIRENYRFEAIFAPGADPNAQPPQQPPVMEGSAQPAAWAAPLVDQAIAENLLPAELQGAYDQPITRREFCVLADALYTKVKGGMASVDTSITFTDTADPAVLRMASAKVVNGTGNGDFTPDGQLTREQAATMLSRLSAALGKPLADSEPTFDDSGSVASWAKAAVGQMQQSGVMGGTGNNQFSPQLTYTREQSVVTMVRLYGMMK